MKIGSLFAGIGGFDLAAQWCGWETAWVSEIDPYASAILKKHFPAAPNHGDITQIKGSEVESVDLLCGGFPCQDISVAGKGAGLEGSRSGLWSHYARLIGEIKPQYAVIENSPRLRTLGIDRVLKDLDAFGYDAEWHCIPASAIGASHRRDRVWIVAYANSERLQGYTGNGSTSQRQGEVGPVTPRSLRGGTGEVRNTCCDDFDFLHDGSRVERSGEITSAGEIHTCHSSSVTDEVCDSLRCGCCWHKRWGPRPFAANGRWWDTEPHMGRVAHGVPNRVDRMRAIGNAIVPQVAYQIFQAIDAHRRANLRVR